MAGNLYLKKLHAGIPDQGTLLRDNKEWLNIHPISVCWVFWLSLGIVSVEEPLMTVRLYAGNLPDEVDRDAFEALFRSVAEVLSVKIVRDRKTNLCRGFAFVTVSTPEIAETLISRLHGTEFGGQTLKLEIAQPKEPKEPKEAREKETEEKAVQSEDASEDSAEVKEAAPVDRPRLTPKKREKPDKEKTTTLVEPDPRWASQLQRIKEQLMATGQS